MSEPLYLTAKEAAAELNISVSTLYSYVSRNRIRSTQPPGSNSTRNRRYWKADVERLKAGHIRGKEDPLTSNTKITLLTKDGLFYRGHNVDELANHASLETVAALLWNVEPDAIFNGKLPTIPTQYRSMNKLVQALPITEKVMALFPFFEHSNPRSYDLSPTGIASTGADVLRIYAAIIGGVTTPSTAPIHHFLAEKLAAPAGFDDIIRRLLVLVADHELDPSTYAVRALANTGITPYQAAITGQMASNGRRLWIGLADATSRLLNEILTEKDPATPILRRFKSGEELPGFEVEGIHKILDPRPAHLLRALKNLLVKDEEFERLNIAINTAHSLADANPHLILLVIFISHKLNIKDSVLSIGTLARSTGWIAHASEQYHDHKLVRPHADYVGELPEKVTK